MSAGAQDELMTLVHEEYGPRYLAGVVYPRMARHVGPDARVVEVGVRPEDRGVISRDIIPHAAFLPVDRDPIRAAACKGIVVDALLNPILADVVISTCIVHHTYEKDVPQLLGNLRAPLLLLSGPNAETHEPYGDHRYHLQADQMQAWLAQLGYSTTIERVGLTEPFCELLIVARKS